VEYNLEIREHLIKKFKKLKRKDPKQLKAIWKKIREIVKDPLHYKHLKKPLQT